MIASREELKRFQAFLGFDKIKVKPKRRKRGRPRKKK